MFNGRTNISYVLAWYIGQHPMAYRFYACFQTKIEIFHRMISLKRYQHVNNLAILHSLKR